MSSSTPTATLARDYPVFKTLAGFTWGDGGAGGHKSRRPQSPHQAELDAVPSSPPPSSPDFLDGREVPDENPGNLSLAYLQKRADLHLASNQAMQEVIQEALATGEHLGESLEHWHHDARDTIHGWWPRLGHCGEKIINVGCPDGHHAKNIMECCQTPVCSWTATRLAQEWQERGDAMIERYPDGITWGRFKELLREDGVEEKQIAKYGKHRADDTEMHWVFTTNGLRDTGNLRVDVDTTLTYRAKLARYLRDKQGMVAGYIPLDCGADHGHPHLHGLLLVFDYIDRDEVIRWQRKQDCTVRGCKHPADDRCNECKAAKCECHHPHADGTPRCNGSWDFDVRKAENASEVLKYVCSPSVRDTDLRLAVYLSTFGRDRIMAYGLAKKNAIPGLKAALAKAAKDAAEVENICAECGQEYVYLSASWRGRRCYHHERYRYMEPYRPPSRVQRE